MLRKSPFLSTASRLLTMVGMLVAASSANAIPIDWVTVGNPGNAADSTGYGAVPYTYDIMKFEFTNSQYTAFLNAIDPDGTNPQLVYSGSMGTEARGGINQVLANPTGSRYVVKANMGDKPVAWTSWLDAARVANWLHNGAQTYGSTNSSGTAPQNVGAYTLGTATSGTAPAVNPGAKYWIPTENEWYKAAYYDPTLSGTGGYHVFGNGFDTEPTRVGADTIGTGSAGPTGNFANYNRVADWNGQDGNYTTVGTNGASSYYGAFDFSGNAWELNSLTGAANSVVGNRGGSWGTAAVSQLSSSFRDSARAPGEDNAIIGFRLVPEPSSWAIGLAGMACGGWAVWRRKR